MPCLCADRLQDGTHCYQVSPLVENPFLLASSPKCILMKWLLWSIWSEKGNRGSHSDQLIKQLWFSRHFLKTFFQLVPNIIDLIPYFIKVLKFALALLQKAFSLAFTSLLQNKTKQKCRFKGLLFFIKRKSLVFWFYNNKQMNETWKKSCVFN